MMPELKSLVARLNPLCRRATEKAADQCLRRTQFSVEIEHLLLELCALPEGDFARALRAYGIEPETCSRELSRAIDRFKRGNTRTPTLSKVLVDMLIHAWTLASLDLQQQAIRSGAILRAVLEDDRFHGLVTASCPALAAVPRARLVEDMPEIMRGGHEDEPAARPQAAAPGAAAPRQPGSTTSGADPRTPALDAYTVDLTAEARADRIDPIVGRDDEIRQVIDVLMRRRQNNPILTGDAGVGKTAIVEGFAQRVVQGRVPPALAGVVVRSLDLGQLQAGAGIRGEFEHRLRSVIEEVSAASKPIVLFIDEAHTLIGAGNQAGQGDAANLLKPALARGTLRTIAATTWGEYKRYFEKDPALARRFQVIKVAEPSEATAGLMVRGLVPRLEAHHGVRILDEAVSEVVRLSHRYISGRQLPDKAISVLDTACARVAIAGSDKPAGLQEAEGRCHALSVEISQLEREQHLGSDHRDRMELLSEERDRADEHRARLEARWSVERDTVMRIRRVETAMASADAAAGESLRGDLARLRLELSAVQQDEPLIPLVVDSRVIAEVVAGWTGIPVGRMLSDTVTTARTLKERMAERVIGQDVALDTICRRVQTFYADLNEAGKPTGVFLLTGPSGVGKTETAIALAELLFGGTSALITVNMSEYQEAHTVSGLKGAPPGYVGYGKGGVLTEAVRRRPYSVLLLDEIEKAHPDVIELFYQVFDKGTLEDSEGQLVDFTNTVILATSNVGAERLTELHDAAAGVDLDTAREAIRPALRRHFPAAFLGRLVVVPYRPLRTADIDAIVRLRLQRIRERFAASYRAELTCDDAVVRALATRAETTESGARTIDAILSHTLLPQLSGHILDRLTEGETIAGVHIALAGDGSLAYELW
ncbi:MAG: type VI secretion system ATPase TssH [Rhodospirillales bacterium]|nr:MAG: type VI secretion system ATPase TssH [Rhodospirillales bacterium]